jgi:hypothetical protein
VLNQSRRKGGDALDLLEQEDRAIAALFTQLGSSTGPAVKDRYDHGNQSKRLTRRIAFREAAKADLVRVLGLDPELEELRVHLAGAVEQRRDAMNVLDQMSRGVRPIDLNKTQDLDGAIDELRRAVLPEIHWELTEGIGTIRNSLSAEQRAALHSAHYVRHHSPTKVNPKGFRRYEHIGFVGWVLTVWDHMLDRPRPVKGSQAE